MDDTARNPPGLREIKKRQTRQRIAEAGLSLFLAKGYEATTLEEIAAAAGISRRTFFHYFKAKDEILLAQLDSYVETVRASIRRDASSAASPLDTARDALLSFASRFQSPQAIAVARLMRNNAVLRARGANGQQRLEKVLYESLCELWPEPERRDRLRVVAMVSVAVWRFGTLAWFERDYATSLEQHVRDGFAHLKAEI